MGVFWSPGALKGLAWNPIPKTFPVELKQKFHAFHALRPCTGTVFVQSWNPGTIYFLGVALRSPNLSVTMTIS